MPRPLAAVVDGYASERQYLEHLASIWAALPAEARGRFHVSSGVERAAALHNVGPLAVGRPGPGGPVMVASFQDHRDARRAGRPVVYVEHGAGQTYRPEPGCLPHPSYSGGPEHDGTVLFVCPSETVADRWRAAYPAVPAVVVGCPKLDAFHVEPRAPARTPAAATVAVSFHADVGLCPESRSAWRHYEPHLPAVVAALRGAGAHVLGHAHPRLYRRVARTWWEAGAEPVEDFAEVLARADVYCVDNSCVDPAARVLCADLRWRPAGELTVGMEIVACDDTNYRMGRLRSGLEVPREDRRLRTAYVTANEVRPLRRLRVETTHGTMSVSFQHPWLVRRRVPYIYSPPRTTQVLHRSYAQWAWDEADNLRVGDEVAFLVAPWEIEDTREGRNLSALVRRATVLSIADEGEQPCAILSTSTGTFIAEGFVAHNSTLFEAASCGMPTVALNAPWYRRDVEHGLRFWSLIPGAVVDGPAGIPGAVVEALADPPWLADRRREVVGQVYAACDGKAAARAADAVVAHAA